MPYRLPNLRYLSGVTVQKYGFFNQILHNCGVDIVWVFIITLKFYIMVYDTPARTTAGVSWCSCCAAFNPTQSARFSPST